MKRASMLLTTYLIFAVNAFAAGGASQHFAAGFDLTQQGQLDAAAVEFKKGLAISPKDAKAHFYLGEIYRQEGQSDLAAKQYALVIQYAPPNSEDANSAIAALDQIRRPTTQASAYAPPPPPPPQYRNIRLAWRENSWAVGNNVDADVAMETAHNNCKSAGWGVSDRRYGANPGSA